MYWIQLVQLLLKSSQDKRFVCEAAETALVAMTTWVSPSLLLPKLQPYLKSKNPRIRAKASMCFSRSVPQLVSLYLPIKKLCLVVELGSAVWIFPAITIIFYFWTMTGTVICFFYALIYNILNMIITQPCFYTNTHSKKKKKAPSNRHSICCYLHGWYITRANHLQGKHP